MMGHLEPSTQTLAPQGLHEMYKAFSHPQLAQSIGGKPDDTGAGSALLL